MKCQRDKLVVVPSQHNYFFLPELAIIIYRFHCIISITKFQFSGFRVRQLCKN